MKVKPSRVHHAGLKLLQIADPAKWAGGSGRERAAAADLPRSPLPARVHAAAAFVRSYTQRAFGGSVKALVLQALMASRKLDGTELEEIEKTSGQDRKGNQMTWLIFRQSLRQFRCRRCARLHCRRARARRWRFYCGLRSAILGRRPRARLRSRSWSCAAAVRGIDDERAAVCYCVSQLRVSCAMVRRSFPSASRLWIRRRSGSICCVHIPASTPCRDRGLGTSGFGPRALWFCGDPASFVAATHVAADLGGAANRLVSPWQYRRPHRSLRVAWESMEIAAHASRRSLPILRAIVGFLKLCDLIPARGAQLNLSTAQLESVLAHEPRAHPAA